MIPVPAPVFLFALIAVPIAIFGIVGNWATAHLAVQKMEECNVICHTCKICNEKRQVAAALRAEASNRGKRP